MAVLWLRFLTEIDEHIRYAPAELASDALVAKALALVEESAYSDAELLAIDKYWDMISCERTREESAEWKISQIRSAGNCKKCPLKKRCFQRTLCVC